MHSCATGTWRHPLTPEARSQYGLQEPVCPVTRDSPLQWRACGVGVDEKHAVALVHDQSSSRASVLGAQYATGVREVPSK